MIFGPVHPSTRINRSILNESSAQLLKAIRGGAPAVTRMPVFVDVRDVAAIHVEGLDLENLPKSERFVVCGGKFTWKAIQEIYAEGTFSADSLAPADEFYTIDTSNVEVKLGINWVSLGNCIKDSLASLSIEETDQNTQSMNPKI
jgi:hypothetical protein